MGNPLPPVMYPAQGTLGPILYLNPYSGTYTSNRAYGLRMQRGYAAGLPQWMARRYGPGGTTPPVSETERRRLNFLQRWGFEERVWRKLYRKYIKEHNELCAGSPAQQITKSTIAQVLQNTQVTGLGADWLEQRLAENLADMKEYRALPVKRIRNPDTEAYQHFFHEASARDVTPIELWWYH